MTLRSQEGWKVKSFNDKTADGLLAGVPKDVAVNPSKFGGYFINGTTADVYIQVFEVPAAQVNLGVTAPKFVIRVCDSTAEPAQNQMEMANGITMKAISVVAMTTETGLTPAAPTGVYILYMD